MAELPASIGRYEVVSRLGQGGMGSLYLARDPKIGRLLAIKLVRQEFDSPDARQRFAREAQSAGTLRHQNIVTIFDVDEHDDLPFIAMEYIDGETLGEIVRRKAPIPLVKRLQWIEDLCSGLAYAHRQGVIHRDIKPANLMVDAEGTLKILDFGLARRDASKFTQSHVLIGTPNYMSPEQIRGGDLDTRSDIFSVGAVLYEVLSYTEAFPGNVHTAMHRIMSETPAPIETLVADLDPRVTRIIQHALEKRVDDRYRDLSAMKSELTEVRLRMISVADGDQVTMPLGPRPTTPIPGSSHRPGTAQSKRFGADRGSLQRRRAEQIEKKLDEARTRFEAGAIDKARESCEDALVFDPDHPPALQLLAEIAAESERRQVAEWLADARVAMSKGQIDVATARVNDALAIRPDAPDVIEMRDAIDAARREMDKARQVQETLRRARAQLAEGAFESAIRIAGEVLALDPGNQAARDLQGRANEAIAARRRKGDVDEKAHSIVAEARTLFEGGDRAGAIRKLQSFPHRHDLVNAFLASVKGEKAEAEPAAAAESVVGINIDRKASGPRLPTRRNRLPMYGAAAAVLIVAAIAVLMIRNRAIATIPEAGNIPEPGNTSAPAPTVSTEPPPAPGSVAPSLPPPPNVSPPPTAAANQNDDDLVTAYQLLLKGQTDAAIRIAAQIRQRDPRYAGLRDLQATIVKAQSDEKARAAAAAAREEERRRAAAAPPVTPAPPVKPDPGQADSAFTVLPGGGFAATSEPPSPPLVSEVERPGIEAAIRTYEKAVTSRDVKAISQIRRYTAQQAENWRKFVENQKEYKLTVEILGPPKVDGNLATILVEETVTQVDRKGARFFQDPRKLDYKLQKIGGQWTLLPPGS